MQPQTKRTFSFGGIPIPLFDTGDEDCLFLDVYVPGKAMRNETDSKLPVVAWIFGGGYVLGSKDAMQPELPFYDGSGLISQSDGNLIFVAMNYRLGAYGFLAGTTMEREAMPNAGLWDQRAALQWIQDYISLVGGDPALVTAMGESAGAGSLMHHLVAGGGTLAPLFKRAILQSPAYQWMWDRAGRVEQTFQTFVGLAGCSSSSISSISSNASVLACLRAADSATLAQANTALMGTVPDGSFAVGPTVDGMLVRQLPVLELATGHYAQDVEALLLSHCSDEATLFVDGSITTDDEFAAFLAALFPEYTQTAGGINDQILAFYPAVANADTYVNEAARFEAFLRDSCFTCHVRHIIEGYGDDRVWSMQYAVTPGWHGSDLVPTFFNGVGGSVDSWLEDLAALVVPVIGPLLAGLSTALQSYLASFATSGDPNTNRVVWNVPSTVTWDHPNSAGEEISGVLNVADLGFSSVSDSQNQKTPCDFWRSVAAAVTSLGGYAPPGSELDQTLVAVVGNPSANYVGGNHVAE